MPTTILDGETYEQARHRRFTEEAKVIEKMQQDEIIRMAKEAGWTESTWEGFLTKFAALVRAESAKEDLEVLENLRKETIAQCEAGMIEAYQLGRAERQWVDLTDDEIVSEFNKSRNNFDYASAVIAAFKEKNR